MTNPTTDEEDEYKKATRTVVDDAMRTDILGPNMLRVLKDHKPVNDLLNQVIGEAISSNTDVKSALNKFTEDYFTNRKGKNVDRGIWLAIGAAVTGLVGFIIIQLSSGSNPQG